MTAGRPDCDRPAVHLFCERGGGRTHGIVNRVTSDSSAASPCRSFDNGEEAAE
jgi:hypothetical protein